VGGTEDVSALLEAVKNGKISETRMREAAKRILVQKFAIGLFENPYVDAAVAKDTVGNPALLKAGQEAQKRAMVLLENKHTTLPIRLGMKVWLFNIAADEAKAHGLVVVDTPEQADVAILRAETPADKLHPGYFFDGRQHEGRLNFQPGDPRL
jgi:beta-glucosidase